MQSVDFEVDELLSVAHMYGLEKRRRRGDVRGLLIGEALPIKYREEPASEQRCRWRVWKTKTTSHPHPSMQTDTHMCTETQEKKRDITEREQGSEGKVAVYERRRPMTTMSGQQKEQD